MNFPTRRLEPVVRITLDKAVMAQRRGKGWLPWLPLHLTEKEQQEKGQEKWSPPTRADLCLFCQIKGDNAPVGSRGIWIHGTFFYFHVNFFCINQKQLIKKEIFNSDMFFELEFHLVLFE